MLEMWDRISGQRIKFRRNGDLCHPSSVKASAAESSTALHRRIMEEQKKRLDIYEEELKKPYPAMTIEDAANYFVS